MGLSEGLTGSKGLTGSEGLTGSDHHFPPVELRLIPDPRPGPHGSVEREGDRSG